MSANSKPYIFISYAHMNSDAVLPAIRQMQAQGVSLWYDSGIEAGSEWPEFVAEKVMNCSKFVLFISKAYLESQNCKRELNFAISRKKDILSVFLEDVELSPGMEMQLGTYQAIFRKRFANDQQFFHLLAREPFFNSCRQSVQPAPAQPQPAPVQPVQTQPAPVQPVQNYQPAQAQQTVGQQASQAWKNIRTTVAQQTQPVIQQASQSWKNTTTNVRNQATQAWQNMQGQPQQTQYQQAQYQQAQPVTDGLPLKNKWIAVLLAFFLGGFGIHKFYLGQKVWGIVYLVLCWTYIPAFVAFVDAVIMLVQSDEKFEEKYKCRLK